MIEQITKWIIFAILIISSISFVIIFQLNYIAEALAARALPLAIVIGLTAIAASIIAKK
ncbi:hypothetical protein [uncultured Rummeliibacillus sp.]|uniref:hypothetical protein n=1 Tax=uncultured Rummeliibacillus sp. TaxID=762292 RepID=UPI002625AD89|nr:hypothetical protein [uncultured Rummeliibacillus sp.]